MEGSLFVSYPLWVSLFHNISLIYTHVEMHLARGLGEQSVGKSFMLNHFADTSFAGSAMRTTEGIWMSVTPTDEVLLVSLDFEGASIIL